jgi:hypothetical protein
MPKERAPNPVMYSPKESRRTTDSPQLYFSPCINCGAIINEGYYGRYQNGGTCSKNCDSQQSQKPLNFGEPDVKNHATTSFRK